MDLFTSLGFHWTRDAVPATLPTHSRERVCFHFHRMLPEFVWDASMLEGNPFTFPEVKTLLDGVTVGGRRLSDQDQVLNLAESSRHLLGLVRSGNFTLDKATFCTLQGIVARKEAPEWRHSAARATRRPTPRMWGWVPTAGTRRCPRRRARRN